MKRKFKKVEVHWKDHHEQGGDFDPAEVDDAKPMIWETRGYLARENDEVIQVARDICRDPDFSPYGATVTIMKNSVVYRSDKDKRRGESTKEKSNQDTTD